MQTSSSCDACNQQLLLSSQHCCTLPRMNVLLFLYSLQNNMQSTSDCAVHGTLRHAIYTLLLTT
jgi:hypothetical protein